MKINPIDPTFRDKKRRKPNDEAYLKFLRTNPSAYSNRRPCIAAHYRTSANSGISIKPLYSAIPLTNPEHDEQHRIGQFKFANRDWWENMVKKYQVLFIQNGGKIPEKYKIDISI